MRFKYEYMTQSQLGELFNVSSHEIGKRLVAASLRNSQTKKPTREAFEGGLCATGPSGQQGYCWVWHAEKTTAVLQKAGYSLAPELPVELVFPIEMVGPFAMSANCERDVVNREGEVVVRTATPKNAEVVARILNAAHQVGTLDRLLGGSKATSSNREEHDKELVRA